VSDSITLTGIVATIPRNVVTNEGLAITSFRLASTQRRFDKSQERWIDGETNWFTITGFRQLAHNLASSVNKGDRVVVSGRLRIRDWQNGERTGTTVEVEADSLGHDISWGTSVFSRSVSTSVAAQPSAETANSAETADSALESNSAEDSWGVPMGGAVGSSVPVESSEERLVSETHPLTAAATPF